METTQAVRIISSMATKQILGDMLESYQRQSGQAIVLESVGGVDAAKRVQAGETLDLVILASNAIDQLLASAKARQGSKRDLVRSGIAVAVRAGQPHPDIGTEDAVKQAVLGAKSVSYSTGPSGVYLSKLFERWGVASEVAARTVQAPPGVPVGSLVAQGKVELGFQQLSELINLPGIDVLGPLPPAIQLMTVFSGALCTSCECPQQAQAVLEFLASPANVELIRRQGMEPA